jgi:two-component system response regulator FixJ
VTNETAKVYVVDDDESVRNGLARLLRATGYAVETYASAEEYLSQAGENELGAIILDLSMPEVDGIELQRRLLERGDGKPIIFLSGHADVPTSVKAMKRGAEDFLTKPVDEEALLNALRHAISRQRRELAERREEHAVSKLLASLTPREHQILRHVIAGARNKQIAHHLEIAEKTVKVHRARVMDKMRVQSVAELVQACHVAGVSPVKAD